jgi:diadenosine tetraphosphate (Ap4A) HIT family hydrolase
MSDETAHLIDEVSRIARRFGAVFAPDAEKIKVYEAAMAARRSRKHPEPTT